MGRCSWKGCLCSCCGCVVGLAWGILVLLSIIAAASQASFCDPSISPEKAAADARPDVYDADGSIKWDSVSSGWNTACGDIPANFSEVAAKYAAETGGLELVLNDSAFKKNAWSDAGGNFKSFTVQKVEEVDGFPFGERPKSIQRVSSMFGINLFFMPTATKENVGWMTLQYEVCAYFETHGERNIRLYKTTESPLGETDPFVQVFDEGSGDPLLLKYHVVSEKYNDSPPGVGKARFHSLETDGCPIWGVAPLIVIILLSVILLALCVFAACFVWRARKK